MVADGFERVATGFAIDRNTVVSVAHVGPRDYVCVYDIAGDRFRGRVIDVDKRWDLVFIEVDRNIEPVNVSPGKPPLGSLAISCGMPYGILRPFLTMGVVSGYNVSTYIGGDRVEGLMVVSTPTLYGMSGGPVVDIYGSAIGMLVANTMNGNEFALATPSRRIYYDYAILSKLGRIARIRLGVRVIEGFTAGVGGSVARGLTVVEVQNERLTSVCGIKAGDVLLSINDIETSSLDSLWDSLDRAVLRSANRLRIRFRDMLTGLERECEFEAALDI